MNKKIIAIILVVMSIALIILGIITQCFYTDDEKKQYNRIPTNYICKKKLNYEDKTITIYRKITTDEFLSIQNVNHIIEYNYVNNFFYEAEKSMTDENYKYEYDDKNMIISMTALKNDENVINQYYYSYISYFEPGFVCTPHNQKSNYEFTCSNGKKNFNLITDSKLVVTDIKNNIDEQLLLDNSGGIQKLWINKYIQELNDNYSCELIKK